MEESQFHQAADQFLQRLAMIIEDQRGDELEAELLHGILTVDLPSGQQYVLNKHAPSRQIWLSSPVSGASHYDFYAAGGLWVAKRGGRDLAQVLREELLLTL